VTRRMQVLKVLLLLECVLLFLGAHSDDIEIGCGGTILALTEAYSGLNILWAVLSAKGKRRQEARSSEELFLKGAMASKLVVKQFHESYFPGEFDRIKAFCESLKSLARRHLYALSP
jgi:hypothetical protein